MNAVLFAVGWFLVIFAGVPAVLVIIKVVRTSGSLSSALLSVSSCLSAEVEGSRKIKLRVDHGLSLNGDPCGP